MGEHGVHFFGDAGEDEDGGVVFGGEEAGGGAGGVVEDFGGVGTKCLKAVGGGHGAVLGFEPGFDLDDGGRVFDELLVEGVGEGLAGEVVEGGAEAAGDDEERNAMIDGFADGVDDGEELVGEGEVGGGGDAEGGELLGVCSAARLREEIRPEREFGRR